MKHDNVKRAELKVESSRWKQIYPLLGAALALELADSHIHLADYPDPLPIIEMAEQTGVMLVSVSTGFGSASRTLELRSLHPSVIRFFAGVHPAEANKGDEADGLQELWAEADGIGEIGLDPKYSPISGRSPQGSVFARQLEVAERMGMPVQVHSRGAEAACLQALSRVRVPKVLMHWFEDESTLAEVVSRGYYVSFGPALLYSRKLGRIAKAVPADLLLVESDGPVPFSAIGGAGGSFLLPSVIFALSELRGEIPADIMSQVFRNTLKFLRGNKAFNTDQAGGHRLHIG